MFREPRTLLASPEFCEITTMNLDGRVGIELTLSASRILIAASSS